MVITYGAGDRDARALVMTLEKLDVSWMSGLAQIYGDIDIDFSNNGEIHQQKKGH